MKCVIKKLIHIIIIIVFVCTTTPFTLPAQAATITSFQDNLSRLQTSTLANHTIKFVSPSLLSGGMSIVLTFDADFNMGSFALANFDLAQAATCNGAFTDIPLVTGSPSNPDWQIIQSGQTVSFINSANWITAGNCVLIEIGSNATYGGTGTAQITNPATPQVATLNILTSEDSGSGAVVIVATGGDQVSVTANVDIVLTFSINAFVTSVTFETLSSSAAKWAGDGTSYTFPWEAHSISVSTNAASGYTLYVKGATLTSGANTIDAIGGSATASNPGTEQFGIKLTASGGTGTVLSPYNTANYAYAATSSVQDDLASSSGPSATTTYSMLYLANISSITEPGSYSTTLTYTATGLF